MASTSLEGLILEGNKGREGSLQKVVGDSTLDRIQNAKLLVVGAGGIGCELLKNLVLSNFKHIHIIDLDTIDLSNLNRQFLFQKQHIGKAKAHVAKESAMRYIPSAVAGSSDGLTITSYHANIKDSTFGVSFFNQFDLVCNALDNLGARRHVNRVCLASGVPLIESGTSGYLGQVSVHVRNYGEEKGQSECYECVGKSVGKTYPTCTIRNNPSLPIHTILWAKFLFSKLFGKKDEFSVTELDEDNANKEKDSASEVIPINQQDEDELNALKKRGDENSKHYAEYIFYKVFYYDIKKLSAMTELWKERQPPNPLRLPSSPIASSSSTSSTTTTRVAALEKQHPGQLLRDQEVWNIDKNISIFMESCTKLKNRIGPDNFLEWDKDDNDSLDFVTAASNIRSYIFLTIPLQSKFDVKSSAGNIIPAIATTNAIIAGLIVIEAIKIISKKPFSQLRSSYILKKPSRKKMIMNLVPEPPSQTCFVCQTNFITLRIDTLKTPFSFFLEKVLVNSLGFNEPNIDTGTKYIEGGTEGLEPEDLENRKEILGRSLAELDIANNSLITADDQSQDLKLQITIQHTDEDTFPVDEQKFVIVNHNNNNNINNKPAVSKPATESTGTKPAEPKSAEPKSTSSESGLGKRKREELPATNTTTNADDDDDIQIVVPGAPTPTKATTAAPPQKKQKTVNNANMVIDLD